MTRTDNDTWDLTSPHCVEEPGTIMLFERWLESDACANEVLHTEHFRRDLSITEPLYAARAKCDS